MSNAGTPGLLGRVEIVDDSLDIIWVKLGNGTITWLSAHGGPAVEPGSVIMVDEDGFDLAPASLFLKSSWVGVVRVKDDDRTLIEGPLGFTWLPTRNDLTYGEWDSVECDDYQLLRRVADKPIRLHDSPPPIDAIHNRFHVPSGAVTETFADVAGLDRQIGQLRDLIANMYSPETFAEAKVKPVRGVLFAGESGTGKTLLARALANEAKAEFFQVRGPEVTSKWVNESEETLRLLFDHAKQFPRAILFLDEIDSIASARSSSSHEMSNRFVTQLLTLMDGFIDGGNILVLGATNRPDQLDSTLLRPGRFDWHIDFTLPDEDARKAILHVRAPSNIEEISDDIFAYIASVTENWSGADLGGIWTAAWMFSKSEHRSTVRPEDVIVGLERMRDRRSLRTMPGKA